MDESAIRAECKLLNLLQANVGARFRVTGLRSQPAVCARLREMGFCETAEIHKVAQHGALICVVCGAKVALSRRLAEQIMVEPLIPSPSRLSS